MNDDGTVRDTALVSSGRQLPARIALAQRGLVLAEVLVRRAEAKRHLDQAWDKWRGCCINPSDDPNWRNSDWVPLYDDEDPENAILAFDEGVIAVASWIGVAQKSSITDLARELMQEPEWRRLIELSLEHDEELRREFPDRALREYEPWMRGGMEQLITNIEKLNSGLVQLADLGWTGHDLNMELMLFLESVSDWFDPAKLDAMRTESRDHQREKGQRSLGATTRGVVTVPELGERHGDISVISVMIKTGDTVRIGQPLLELSTDKIDFEIGSDVAGRVKEVMVSIGDKVKIGQPLLAFEDDV